MPARPRISVVMLSYNRRSDVLEGLRHLLDDSPPDTELIVVDNGSADGTVAAVQEAHGKRVRVLALAENIGVAAYNRGFFAATGEYVVILDDDSFPAPGTLGRMLAHFAADAQLAVAAFDVRNYHDFDTVRRVDGEAAPAAPARCQLAFNGAGVGIRRDVLTAVGGYPEEFFLYWNEQDLSLRILQAGYAVRFFPDLVAYHKYSPVNRSSERAPFFYTRNLFWLIWKNFPWPRLVRDTVRLLFYVIYYSLEQRTPVYVRAAFHALAGLPLIRGKRRPVGPRIVRDLRLTYKLPFVYFR